MRMNDDWSSEERESRGRPSTEERLDAVVQLLSEFMYEHFVVDRKSCLSCRGVVNSDYDPMGYGDAHDENCYITRLEKLR